MGEIILSIVGKLFVFVDTLVILIAVPGFLNYGLFKLISLFLKPVEETSHLEHEDPITRTISGFDRVWMWWVFSSIAIICHGFWFFYDPIYTFLKNIFGVS